MKKMLICMLAVAGSAFTAVAAEPNGFGAHEVAQRVEKSDIGDFDTVLVNVPARVVVRQGDAYGVEILTDNKYSGVSCKVAGGKLVVYSRYSAEEIAGTNVVVNVTVPDAGVKLEAGRNCTITVK